MSSFYDISAIGNSPLGTYGLGTGSYGAYNYPSFGLSNGFGMDMMEMGGYGMTGYNGMGLMGMNGFGMSGFPMYNPSFMRNVNTTMQDVERDKLNHSSAMHNMLADNELEAYKKHDNTLFAKAMVDSGVQGGVIELAKTIRDGHADEICVKYDNLKNLLIDKYSKYLYDNSDTINVEPYIRRYIEDLYAQIISKQVNEPASLRNDIEKYGETAFTHGVNSTYFNNSGYHKMYTEEVLSYIYDENIDSKGRKDTMENIGKTVGHVAEAGMVGTTGAGLATAATAVASINKKFRDHISLVPTLDKDNKPIIKDGKKLMQGSLGKALRKTGKYAFIAGSIAGLCDLIWQYSRA